MSQVHSIPINDGRDHVVSANCWCSPLPQDVFDVMGLVCGKVVIHNALDCRERFERQGIKNPRQKWINVIENKPQSQ